MKNRNLLLLTDGSKSKPQWFESALSYNGHSFVSKHYRDFLYNIKYFNFLEKVSQKLFNTGVFSLFFSVYICSYIILNRPKYLVVIKGNSVWPFVTKLTNKLGVKSIFIFLDDMNATHNCSFHLLKTIRYVDYIFTNKSYNVSELKIYTEADINFFNNRYSLEFHSPILDSNKQDGYDVLFVGSYEKDRFDILSFLANNGIIVNVFGNGWPKTNIPGLVIHYKSLDGINYSSAIAASKISLNFLRKINRDLQTTRSVEIPACGGLILTENTSEHKYILPFPELLFDNKEDCLVKINNLLVNKNLREELMKKSHNRVVNELKLNYENLFQEIFTYIQSSES